ncbi:MAG TPA: energy transducer TonB [Acidobacteriaceae bacterium]|jgi:protein TonB|nr:energy transducer TonB [Acidobacteriaceae bacterium]
MTSHFFVLWLALFTAQATTPATQPTATAPSQAPPTESSNPNTNFSDLFDAVSDLIPPKILYQPPPKYSEIARQQKINGIATVSLIINVKGRPENVHITKSIADTVDPKQQAAALSLNQAVVDAVKKYKFSPAMKDGKPVAVYLNVEVNFEIH